MEPWVRLGQRVDPGRYRSAGPRRSRRSLLVPGLPGLPGPVPREGENEVWLLELLEGSDPAGAGSVLLRTLRGTSRGGDSP